MWVPIIWINTQKCKAGFLPECFVHYELPSVSPSAWTTLMGPAAPWPSSPLLPCSLAKCCFSGCAMQDHVYHELQVLRPSSRVWRWEERRKAGREVVFHSWHQWQIHCAPDGTFSTLPPWGDVMLRVLRHWGLWEGWCGSTDVGSSGGPRPRGKVRGMGKWTTIPAVLCSSSETASFPFHTAADNMYAFPFVNGETNRERNKHWRFSCFLVQQNPIFQWKNM